MRVLSYGTGHGYPPLREVLAAEHGASPDQVLVTNGSLQGFVFLLETLLEPGDLVAVEAPTYDRALLQLRLHGMEVLPVPVEDDGMDVEALRAACAAGRVPRLLYTIPNFQNPSGATLSAGKRRALVEVCDEHDVLVLEDDPYGKLRFEGEALPGLAELAAPGRVHLHLVVLEDGRAGPAGGLHGLARPSSPGAWPRPPRAPTSPPRCSPRRRSTGS